MTQEEIIKEVKTILPAIALIATQRKLKFDFGYILANENTDDEPYWECELYNEAGETIEYYTAITSTQLVENVLDQKTN